MEIEASGGAKATEEGEDEGSETKKRGGRKSSTGGRKGSGKRSKKSQAEEEEEEEPEAPAEEGGAASGRGGPLKPFPRLAPFDEQDEAYKAHWDEYASLFSRMIYEKEIMFCNSNAMWVQVVQRGRVVPAPFHFRDVRPDSRTGRKPGSLILAVDQNMPQPIVNAEHLIFAKWLTDPASKTDEEKQEIYGLINAERAKCKAWHLSRSVRAKWAAAKSAYEAYVKKGENDESEPPEMLLTVYEKDCWVDVTRRITYELLAEVEKNVERLAVDAGDHSPTSWDRLRVQCGFKEVRMSQCDKFGRPDLEGEGVVAKAAPLGAEPPLADAFYASIQFKDPDTRSGQSLYLTWLKEEVRQKTAYSAVLKHPAIDTAASKNRLANWRRGGIYPYNAPPFKTGKKGVSDDAVRGKICILPRLMVKYLNTAPAEKALKLGTPDEIMYAVDMDPERPGYLREEPSAKSKASKGKAKKASKKAKGDDSAAEKKSEAKTKAKADPASASKAEKAQPNDAIPGDGKKKKEDTPKTESNDWRLGEVKTWILGMIEENKTLKTARDAADKRIATLELKLAAIHAKASEAPGDGAQKKKSDDAAPKVGSKRKASEDAPDTQPVPVKAKAEKAVADTGKDAEAPKPPVKKAKKDPDTKDQSKKADQPAETKAASKSGKAQPVVVETAPAPVKEADSSKKDKDKTKKAAEPEEKKKKGKENLLHAVVDELTAPTAASADVTPVEKKTNGVAPSNKADPVKTQAPEASKPKTALITETKCVPRKEKPAASGTGSVLSSAAAEVLDSFNSPPVPEAPKRKSGRSKGKSAAVSASEAVASAADPVQAVSKTPTTPAAAPTQAEPESERTIIPESPPTAPAKTNGVHAEQTPSLDLGTPAVSAPAAAEPGADASSESVSFAAVD